jgi:hypothetical protein
MVLKWGVNWTIELCVVGESVWEPPVCGQMDGLVRALERCCQRAIGPGGWPRQKSESRIEP